MPFDVRAFDVRAEELGGVKINAGEHFEIFRAVDQLRGRLTILIRFILWCRVTSFHHVGMVLVGGAPRRGHRGAASALLQITERLLER